MRPAFRKNRSAEEFFENLMLLRCEFDMERALTLHGCTAAQGEPRLNAGCGKSASKWVAEPLSWRSIHDRKAYDEPGF